MRARLSKVLAACAAAALAAVAAYMRSKAG